ncbi:MAG: hypothetical protein K6A65_00135 [Succinivibrionaceae bacterium]|nr:hypothetical protein [Succinivibrionaceae bacterium]
MSYMAGSGREDVHLRLERVGDRLLDLLLCLMCLLALALTLPLPWFLLLPCAMALGLCLFRVGCHFALGHRPYLVDTTTGLFTFPFDDALKRRSDGLLTLLTPEWLTRCARPGAIALSEVRSVGTADRPRPFGRPHCLTVTGDFGNAEFAFARAGDREQLLAALIRACGLSSQQVSRA